MYLVISIQNNIRSLRHSNHPRKKILEYTHIREKEVKLPLFTHDMFLPVENLKNLTRYNKTNMLKVIKKLTKHLGYNINLQK